MASLSVLERMCGPAFQNTPNFYTWALKMGIHLYTYRWVIHMLFELKKGYCFFDCTAVLPFKGSYQHQGSSQPLRWHRISINQMKMPRKYKIRDRRLQIAPKIRKDKHTSLQAHDLTTSSDKFLRPLRGDSQ